MISFITGKVRSKFKDSMIVLTSGGIGYEIKMPAVKLVNYRENQEVSFYAYLKVSENALDLYGFETLGEREFFVLLMTVSGIGPKTAMNILSLGAVGDIQGAIGRGDVKYLTAVSGLGKKTAERLVVELKGKVFGGESSVVGDGEKMGDVIEALTSMGYSREEAKQAVESVEKGKKSTEDVLRAALKVLGLK